MYKGKNMKNHSLLVPEMPHRALIAGIGGIVRGNWGRESYELRER